MKAANIEHLELSKDANKTRQLKYKKVYSVWWLSFYDALQSVYRTLEPPLTYLADTTLKDPMADT